MGKIWLEPGEKIEAFRNQRTLRLVTTKTKASTLIQGLDETLKRAVAKPISMDHVPSKAVDEAVLEEVGHITNTHVRKIDEANQVRNFLLRVKPFLYCTSSNICFIDFRYVA